MVTSLIAAHLQAARLLLEGTEANSDDERDWVQFSAGVGLDLAEFGLTVGSPRNPGDLADDLRMLAAILEGAHAASIWVQENWKPDDDC